MVLPGTKLCFIGEKTGAECFEALLIAIRNYENQSLLGAE